MRNLGSRRPETALRGGRERKAVIAPVMRHVFCPADDDSMALGAGSGPWLSNGPMAVRDSHRLGLSKVTSWGPCPTAVIRWQS